MANPYYIPRERSPLMDVAGVGLRLAEMDQAERLASTRSRLMQEQNDLTRQGMKLKQQEDVQKYGGKLESGEQVQGLEPRKLSVMETQANAEAEKARADAAKNPQTQQFTIAESNLIRKGLADQGLDKPMGRFLGVLDNMGKDNKFTKGYTYQYIKKNWPAYQQMMVEDISKELQKTTDPMQAEKLTALLKGIGADQDGVLLDAAMPETARAIQLENAGVAAKTKENLSPLGKLVREYNALPPGDPQRKFYEGAMAKQAQSEGLQLTMDKDGNITFTQGALGAGGMTKPVQTDLQKKAITTGDNIARLEAIGQQFDPSFMEIESRFGATKTKWKEKLGMASSPEEKAQLSKYSAFSRDAIENINGYIKEITGAQMSEKEADRIRKAMPDPGEGLFDGDSPTEFKAKWRSAMKSLKLSQARASYLLKSGVTEQALKSMAKTNTLPSFGQIEETIKARNLQLEQEIKTANPQASQQQIDAAVAKQLKAEFGI